MGCIYKLTNKINGKVYIGKTIHTLNIRLRGHKNSMYTTDTKLTRAFRKYGFKNFDADILEDSINDAELDALEIKYIKQYDSFKSGYNSTIGGDGHSIYTKEDIDIVIDLYKKYNNIKEVYKITGIHTATIRLMLKSANEYIDKHSEKIGVVMYSKEFIPEKYFKSIYEIAEYLHVDKGNLYNRIKKHYDGSIFIGHRWQLLSDVILESEEKIFRTKFDKEEYIKGKKAYKPDGKQYYIVDGALDFIYKNNKQEEYLCKYCGNKVATKSCICVKCEQRRRLVKSGKMPIPTRDELLEDMKNLSNRQIAEKYKRNSIGTVYTWKKKYGLI